MQTATLHEVFSVSIYNAVDLTAFKSKLYIALDDDLCKVCPEGFLAILDGNVYEINDESDYDVFVKKLDEYFKKRNIQKKILTVSLFYK